MAKMYPMLIDEDLRARLRDLAKKAEQNVVPMLRLAQLTENPKGPGLEAHMQQMVAQTMDIPMCYCVTYSVEEQPFGLARHMSLSITTPGARIPHPVALWEVACLLGFWGNLCDCDSVYPEPQTQAINLVQRMAKDSRAQAEQLAEHTIQKART